MDSVVTETGTTSSSYIKLRNSEKRNQHPTHNFLKGILLFSTAVNYIASNGICINKHQLGQILPSPLCCLDQHQ